MHHLWFLVYTAFSVLLAISSKTDDIQTFIIRVENDFKPSLFPEVEDWYSATLWSLGSTLSTTEKTKESKDFVHVYKTVFHGFSARLTQEEAEELKTRHGILSVLPDRIRQIHTTRSTQFLGLLASNPHGLLTESDSGSNIVIGILDSGITPEHPSFHDEGLGPVPSGWKGECIEGEQFTKNLCNKKIVGARYFSAGYEARSGKIEMRSPRDTQGHGTHTASTAAGRAVANASTFGYARGVAVGVAPKARIASYKICWAEGCVDSDILAGIDKAVEDGVNVISISIGGSTLSYHLNPIAIGAFGAMERGVFVSASAGNNGPIEMTVTNIAPWITTVGASTIDRSFPADLVLEDGTIITGMSIYSGKPLPQNQLFPLVYAGSASSPKNFISSNSGTCMPGSLDKELVRGKIVMCDRGGIARVEKANVVRDAGGIGVIVANVWPMGEGLVADPYIIPGKMITESANHKVRAYISSTRNPRATMVFHGTQMGVKPAPVVASFSSRGPSPESLYVLKPDLIAPGVDILAAWPDSVSPTESPYDTRQTQFNVASGTSMSCPHVSGLAALLKGAHPDWSPAMIRSTLMTTAYTHDTEGKPLLEEQFYNASTIWDMGAGHVDPGKASDPGLVYDLTANDYMEFLCAINYTNQQVIQVARKSIGCNTKNQHKPWNLNYPAISAVFGQYGIEDSEEVITRTVTYVGESASVFSAIVTNPRGTTVTVEPTKLSFTGKGQKQSYTVRVVPDKVPRSWKNIETQSGKLIWTNGKHNVVSPIVVVW